MSLPLVKRASVHDSLVDGSGVVLPYFATLHTGYDGFWVWMP